MNIKYWYEFKGLDEVLNRVEILCNSSVSAKEITGTGSPFSLEYINAKKLQPVYGSQATLGLISKSAFQFIDLHTDDMQGYLVKFYRAGSLYWMGWLDSELYAENLSDSPPYPVEFSGADFNILERLKFMDASDKPFTDINSLLVQLKRCFDKLALPFQRLYIGCTTLPEGVALSTSETALHKLYIQSSNFYDEDNEAMKCREVVESLIQPLGLMMVQRDASVYIFDYNTIKSGMAMKCYNFSTLSYVGDTAIPFELGDVSDIGTVSVDASLGFEEMINNVNITSSIYADAEMINASVGYKNVSDLIDKEENRQYSLYNYSKCKDVENISGKFSRYERTGNYVEGCHLPYRTNPSTISPVYRVKIPTYLIGTDATNFLNVKLQTYVNTRDNPFNDTEGVKDNANAGTIKLHCNLYVTDPAGRILKYCNLFLDKSEGRPEDTNPSRIRNYWVDAVNGRIEPGKFGLWLSHEDVSSQVLDSWITNADYMPYRTLGSGTISSNLIGNGVNIGLNQTGGYIVFEITNKCRIVNSRYDDNISTQYLLSENLVKHLLINNIDIGLNGENGEEISTDDYEFKSYINKKVASDMKGITLKCISANEEKLPVGRANILKKMDTHYELQLGYTRSGQTNILERLLMCTIHSNFTRKNKVISLDVHMTDNPAMRYCTYKNVIQTNGMIITGAKMDFYNATTKITAVDFSADEDKLSSIPYE